MKNYLGICKRTWLIIACLLGLALVILILAGWKWWLLLFAVAAFIIGFIDRMMNQNDTSIDKLFPDIKP